MIEESSATVTVSGNRLFPIFIKLERFHVLIVGGGFVGMEKLSAILRNSPETTVTIISKKFIPAVPILASAYPKVRLLERAFDASELMNKDFVIAATNDREVNRAVKILSEQKRILVNVADTPELCDFYLASVVQKGDLKIAISTNGKSPTVAKRIKETLNDAIPNEIDDVLQRMTGIRNLIGGDFAAKVKKMNEITEILSVGSGAKDEVIPNMKSDPNDNNKTAPTTVLSLPNLKIPSAQINDTEKIWRNRAMIALGAFSALLLGNIILYYYPLHTLGALAQNLDSHFYIYILTGFVAEMADGALGMGYGVSCSIFLMSLNIPGPAISSSMHTAKMFASGTAGYSHYKFGNVNKKLFRALVIPGVIGSATGACVLYFLGAKYGAFVKPMLAVYALFLGIRIFMRVFKKDQKKKKVKNVGWLAGIGGFLDAIGGGGWGPIVTGTLVSKGRSPKFVVGSVSIAEFFATLSCASMFIILIGVSHWQIILGLILGSIVAAPIAARLAGKLPLKAMFFLVGSMVIFWSLRIIWQVFHS